MSFEIILSPNPSILNQFLQLPSHFDIKSVLEEFDFN